MLTYLIWLVILKPTTDSLFSPIDSIVIVSSTSGSVANTLRGNLQTPPEAADIINWVLWLDQWTIKKSSISDSRNLLQQLLTSDNHNYDSIELKTGWRPAVLLKWWAWPLMVLGNVRKPVLKITDEKLMCFSTYLNGLNGEKTKLNTRITTPDTWFLIFLNKLTPRDRSRHDWHSASS